MTDNPKEKDPLLTLKERRAQALAQLLSKKKIDAIYSTDYKRTKATAQPTATNHGLSISMIQKFKSSHPNYFKNNIGKPILIVGHPIQLLKSSRQPEVQTIYHCR
jgi:hypothetical protein